MKKIISLLIAFVMCFSVIAVSANEMDDVQVIAYDYGVNFEQKPVLVNDRTFVEFGTMTEFLLKDGAIEEKASVDSQTGVITIGKITLTIDSSTATVDTDMAYTLDAAPFVTGETVYIPLRFICENLGYTVEWRGFGSLGDGGFVMINK